MGKPHRILILLGVLLIPSACKVDVGVYPCPLLSWLFFTDGADPVRLSLSIVSAGVSFYIPFEMTAWIMREFYFSLKLKLLRALVALLTFILTSVLVQVYILLAIAWIIAPLSQFLGSRTANVHYSIVLFVMAFGLIGLGLWIKSRECKKMMNH